MNKTKHDKIKAKNEPMFYIEVIAEYIGIYKIFINDIYCVDGKLLTYK